MSESYLRRMRLAAGLSLRELAEIIGVPPSTLRFWETSGQIPGAGILVPMSKALGVTVEELLGEPNLSRVNAPRGRSAKLLATISQLPQRKQKQLLEIIEGYVAQQLKK